ncbi:MAG: protein-disulfide reductase DsbD family protein, partial [Christiangramia sp.]|nr:protein-disulfide reductase DsbD family protein [Christiangramia sp.]
MKILKLILAMIILAVGTSTYGQVKKAPEWKAKIRQSSFNVGDTISVKFTAQIPENWYMYSSDFDPELGPTVTEFQFEENPRFKVIDSLVPLGAKQKYDEIFEGDITYFTKKAVFEQKFLVKAEDPRIKAVASYQICSDVNGQCIPFTSDIPVTGFQKKSSENSKDGE